MKKTFMMVTAAALLMLACSGKDDGVTTTGTGIAQASATSMTTSNTTSKANDTTPLNSNDAAAEQAAAELEFPPVEPGTRSLVAPYLAGLGRPLTDLMSLARNLTSDKQDQTVCRERLAELGAGPSPEQLVGLAVSFPDVVLADAFKALPGALNEYVTRCATDSDDARLVTARLTATSIIEVIVVRMEQLS